MQLRKKIKAPRRYSQEPDSGPSPVVPRDRRQSIFASPVDQVSPELEVVLYNPSLPPAVSPAFSPAAFPRTTNSASLPSVASSTTRSPATSPGITRSTTRPAAGHPRRYDGSPESAPSSAISRVRGQSHIGPEVVQLGPNTAASSSPRVTPTSSPTPGLAMQLRQTTRVPQRYAEESEYHPASMTSRGRGQSMVYPQIVPFNPNLPPAAFPTLPLYESRPATDQQLTVIDLTEEWPTAVNLTPVQPTVVDLVNQVQPQQQSSGRSALETGIATTEEELEALAQRDNDDSSGNLPSVRAIQLRITLLVVQRG